MIAFVTGASGFIGCRLVSDLLLKGWEVRALTHRNPLPFGDRCRVVKGDLLDPDSWRKELKGADVVFHLAAALGASLIDLKGFSRINAGGTESVLAAARDAGVRRVVHFSSAGVLGSVRTGEIADESYPPHPLSDYDLSKLEGERIALQAAENGQNVVILRPGWVYGPGDRRTFKLIRAIEGKRFILVTRGLAKQTPVYIDDLIYGVGLCAERGRSGEIYHLAGDEALTVREIVQAIAEAAGTSIPGWTLPLGPTRLAAWSLEKIFAMFGREAPLSRGKLAFFIHPKPLAAGKAAAELGYSPRISFQDGMALTLSWYRQHKWL